MNEITNIIDNLILKSREIYRSIAVPLRTQNQEQLNITLNQLKNNLERLSEDIFNLNKITAQQYFQELEPKKINSFKLKFMEIANKIHKHLFLEINKKEIRHELVNIKEAIIKPQVFYDLEDELKNEINIFIDYLEHAKKEIQYRYLDIGQNKKSNEELLKVLSHKDNKIHELNTRIEEYRWLEAKEKAKISLISNLENDLIKKTKVTEQNQTLLKVHTLHIENELNSIARHIKQLNIDINHLDNSYLEKEKIALELIKELKDELLATRYALTKLSQETKKE